ncbi:MAG: serine/threonine protein kinase [Sumerlaeia bacterium]
MITHQPVWWDETDEDPFPTPFRERGWNPIGILGRGGMGVVYSAYRKPHTALRAIKVLPPDCSKHPELVDRFTFEIRTMASISHPNIVGIHDFDEVDNQLFFVMNYIAGDNLKNVLRQKKRLRMDEAVFIARGIAEAIEFCHKKNIIHRDLKPANVILNQSGDVVVTDFGIANVLSALGDNTGEGMAIGTPQYVAPEQLKDGSDVDFRADQYSLAVILCEMLTGELPIGMFGSMQEDCPELKPAAEKVLGKALSRDRKKRYSSPRAFMRSFCAAQEIAVNSHKGKILVRRLALYNSPRTGHETPYSSNASKDLFFLTHPARDIPTGEEEFTLEDLLAPEENAPPDKPININKSPQSYFDEETPLSPWWRRR